MNNNEIKQMKISTLETSSSCLLLSRVLWIHLAFRGTGRREYLIRMGSSAQQGVCPRTRVYLLSSFLSSLYSSHFPELLVFPWIYLPLVSVSSSSLDPEPRWASMWLADRCCSWYQHRCHHKLGDIFHVPLSSTWPISCQINIFGGNKFNFWPFTSLWARVTPSIVEEFDQNSLRIELF